eukprot:CAMPEP_0198210220 /NCGR_PEP_ID=MMETSP1445-20131203/19968_1 /TAXON_ID=36898 /ORGANISM="Pyramimonas sp., Strain CCMP2087" /LENGTH=155 /DNA_ID=CAMNT_0043884227 /DNA_START=99 /DNA_END=562 /DNA_ORIENTATION=-
MADDAAGTCSNCGKGGHLARQCPRPKGCKPPDPSTWGQDTTSKQFHEKQRAEKKSGRGGGGRGGGDREGGFERSAGVCGDFQRGTCTRGDGCRFSHDPEAAAAESAGRAAMPRSDQPCYQFTQGTCTRGDACRFSHSAQSVPGSGDGASYERPAR